MDETRKNMAKYSPQYSFMSQLLAVWLLNWKNHGWNQPERKSVFPPSISSSCFSVILALKGNKVCCVCNELIIYLNSIFFYGLELGADS